MGSSDKARYNGKRNFRGSQFTASSKKICHENLGHVSVSSSRIDNSFLINEASNSEEYDEEYQECCLFINRVNILNLINFIGKFPNCDSKLTSTFKRKHDRQ